MERVDTILEKCLARTWEVLNDRYPYTWAKAMGSVWDGKKWIDDLKDLTPDEFKLALELDMHRENRHYLPTSLDIYQMGISQRRSDAAAHQLVPRETNRKAPDQVAQRRWLAYCVGVIGAQPPGQTMSEAEAFEVLEDVDVGAMSERVDNIKGWIKSRYGDREPNPAFDDMRRPEVEPRGEYRLTPMDDYDWREWTLARMGR